jgi:hypothetical protein
MRRALTAVAVAALFLAGCSSEEPAAEETASPSSAPSTTEPSGSAGPSPTESSPTSDDSSTEAIEIEIEGDKIEPNGMRVKVSAGEPILLETESDRAAQLHVHSSPEQVLEVEKGEGTLELVIDRPGVVDIEEHDTGMILLQLEVR